MATTQAKKPAAAPAAAKTKSERLTSPPGIVCFEHVWEPAAMQEGQQEKYSLLLVFEDKALIKELRAKCMAAATAKFGEAEWRKLHAKNKFRFPWRDGDEYEEYGEPFTREGAVFSNFQSTSAPGVVDKRAKPITDRNEFYSGCVARVTYTPWAYDSNGNKGITLLLNNVQKVKDGERLSGKPSAEDDFDATDDADDGLDEGDDDMDI